MPRSQLVGAASAVGAIALLGTSFPAAHALADYPVGTGQAVRYAGAALLLVLAGVRLPRLDLRRTLLLCALAASGLAGFNAFLVAAVRQADPASVGVVIGCLPVVLALRRPRSRVLAAALVATGGAAAVQWAGGPMPTDALWLALAALACEAAFSLLALPLLTDLAPAVVSTYACTLAVPILLAGQLAIAPNDVWRRPTGGESLALAHLAVAVTAGGFLLWYTGVARLGVERAGLLSSLLPVFALAASAVAGGSPISPLRIAGAAGISAAIVVGLRRKPRIPSPPNKEEKGRCPEQSTCCRPRASRSSLRTRLPRLRPAGRSASGGRS